MIELSQADKQTIFLLALITFVCWMCILSIGRSRVVGWYGGPTGHPLAFLTLLAGAVVPPIMLLTLYPQILNFLFIITIAIAVCTCLLFLFQYLRNKSRRQKLKREGSAAGNLLSGSIVGNRETSIYHLLGNEGCQYQAKLRNRKRVYFASPDDAQHSGYEACRWCFPETSDKHQ